MVRSSSALSTLAVRKALAQYGAIERCRLQPGQIVVEFKEEVSPEQIVKVTSINGTEVKVSAPPPTVYMGTIFSQEFQSWSQEELQEELGNQATVIRRLATRNRQASDSGRILLAFPTSLPDSITVDVLQLKLDVRRYIPPPLRCRKCFGYGHHEDSCGKDQRCARCGQTGHSADSCDSPPCCAVCNGPHEVTSSSCKIWQKERQIKQIRLEKGVSSEEARRAYSATRILTKVRPADSDPRPSTAPVETQPAPASTWASVVTGSSPAVGSQDCLMQLLQQQNQMMATQMQILVELKSQNTAMLQLLSSLSLTAQSQQPGPSPPSPPASSTRAKRQRKSSVATPASLIGQPRITSILQAGPNPPGSPAIGAAVANLGKDTIPSPLARNNATHDYKEKNV